MVSTTWHRTKSRALPCAAILTAEGLHLAFELGERHLCGIRQAGPVTPTPVKRMPELDRGAKHEWRSLRIQAAVLLACCLVTAVLSPMSHTAAAAAPCSITFGMHETSAPWDPTMATIRELDRHINRHSAIVHWYAQWGDVGSGAFAANQPWMLNVVRHYTSIGVTGATPLITWEPWGPAPYTASNNTFPLQAIAAGNFDPYIDSWAIGLKVYGDPVMLDVFHEMDGSWYPWGYGVNGNTPADLIAAYRHVHDRFALAGATNVQFVWNVNFWNYSGVDQRDFYPGDAYVDWMAVDAYNWGAAGGGSWESLAQALSDVNVYDRLASLNPDKPMMLAEWASAEPTSDDPPGVTKGQWIIDAARSLAIQFPRIKAVVWFNLTGTPFALDSSSDSMAGAQTAFGGC